jgi:aldose 1-epimerase
VSAWLTLAAGDLRVEVAPAVGGSVARFDRAGQALLRPAPDAEDVLAMACFPLVPYCNRIRGGRFACDGQEVRLAPNMAGDPSPLHGQGWLAAWRVAGADARQVELVFEHAAGAWPWRYEARQVLALDDQGLTLTLACRNLSTGRMPCGLGFHPYYPCDADTVLDTEVEAVWTVDAEVLPVAREPATGRYDLAGRRICGQDLDNGYDGWSGAATIRWPGAPAGLRLTSPDARRFQVYAPADGGFFAAEPVQNANAALNEAQARWAELGISLLAEGETAVTTARFEPIL